MPKNEHKKQEKPKVGRLQAKSLRSGKGSQRTSKEGNQPRAEK